MASVPPTLTNAREDGHVVFRVRWAEPVELTFGSRFEAEHFLAHLHAELPPPEVEEGECGPCAAHHAAGHGCPSCGADLGLRRAPAPGADLRRPVPLVPVPGPDQFLIPREQHRIRTELALEQRQAAADAWLAEVSMADLLYHSTKASGA